MNLLLNLFQRLFNNPKTTSGGVLAGTGLSVAVSMILQQSGCNFEGVNWWVVMGALFGGPAVIGGLSTDNGATVTPVSPVTASTGKLGSILLLIAASLSLTACASYIDYGNGRYGVTRVSEERSPFGTNAGFSYLENCQGTQAPGYNYQKLTFSDCFRVTDVTPIYSQGQGGQVVGGALTGLGFGLGNAFSGASSSSSSTSGSAASSSSSSSAISGAGGHGHGK